MLRELRPALVILVLFSAITGVLYPLAMTGIAQMAFPYQAAGSLIERNGRIVGSALIGQNFTAARYFHPRPSATDAPDPSDPAKTVADPYNAASSGASNLGPTSKTLVDRVQAQATRLRTENPEAVKAGLPIPADLVTTSGSGLDPDISPAAALFQVPRIARARHLPAARVRALVEARTKQPLLGWLGAAKVNVLALNLALDALH